MDEHKREIRWKPIALAALVAVVVHLQLLLTEVLPSMYRSWNGLFPRQIIEQTTEVTLVAMTPQEFEQNRQVLLKVSLEEQQREQEKEEPEEEKDDKRLKGQVVDVAPTPDASRPKKARFLSEHNTNVQKETVSRHRRADYGLAQPRPSVADYSRRRPEKPLEMLGDDRVAQLLMKRGERQNASGEKTFSFEIPEIMRRESLRLKLDLSIGEIAATQASEALRGNSARLRLQDGRPDKNKNVGSGEKGVHDSNVAMFTRPSLDRLDMVTGAPSNDHIEDVPKGAATLLNSREFKYATFFNRVKRGVSQYWSPVVGEEYLRRDPYGNIYGVKDRRTLLSVSLDDNGELIDVELLQVTLAGSWGGVKVVDNVAIQSFRDASPFPNPPLGLVENDGRIHFQFGFYFMIGDRPGIRAFQFQRRSF